jgi:hypothetical protein
VKGTAQANDMVVVPFVPKTFWYLQVYIQWLASMYSLIRRGGLTWWNQVIEFHYRVSMDLRITVILQPAPKLAAGFKSSHIPCLSSFCSFCQQH